MRVPKVMEITFAFGSLFLKREKIDAARSRRRGNRMRERDFRFWPEADMQEPTINVRLSG